ncbi:MAG: HK97 family phage prohead protease [Planctomycetaceae bacterium]
MEHKQFASYIGPIDEAQGIVEKIVAVMGNIDQGNDRIWNGAFSKTIQERGLKIKGLDQHDSRSVRNVVAKTLEMRELNRAELPPDLLLKYPDATGGLWVKAQYILGTQPGREVFTLIREGAVDEASIGYDPIIAEYSSVDTAQGKKTIRELKELKLFEWSDVIWGMNSATANLSAKDAAPAADEAKVKPGDDETEEAFMARCIPAMVNEGREQDQAVAMCVGMFAEGTKDDDEEKRKRRRRKLPAAGTGAVHAVVLDSADPPEEAKAGRRVRKEKLEEARAAMATLDAFLKWADYDEESEPPDEGDEEKPKAAAGPDLHPRQKQAMIERLKLELTEV